MKSIRTAPWRGVKILAAALMLVATLFAVSPAASASSTSGLSCSQNGASLTVTGPGTAFNVLRNGRWIKHVKGANLADSHVDFKDSQYSQGDSYQAIFWINVAGKSTRTPVDCVDGGTPTPDPLPTPVIELRSCTADKVTVKLATAGIDADARLVLTRDGSQVAKVRVGDADFKWINDFNAPATKNTYTVAVMDGALMGDASNAVMCDLTPVTPVEDPAIKIVKLVNGNDANSAPGPTLDLGTTATFKYTITNTGDVSLSNVAVKDSVLGAVDCGNNNSLAVGGSFMCTASKRITEDGSIFMTGSVVGTSPEGEVVSDNDPVNFTVPAALGQTSSPIACFYNLNADGSLDGVSFEDDVYGRFLSYHSYSATSGAGELLRDEAIEGRVHSLTADMDNSGRWLALYDFAGGGGNVRFYPDLAREFTVIFKRPVNPSPVVVQGGVFFSAQAKGYSPSEPIRCINGAPVTPIGLDLDGSGTVERVSGVEVDFDFNGDGETVTATQWFAPSEGILFDASVPGPITGEHLFGDQGGTYADGYEKLATRDSNGDNTVSGSELAGLAIWTDANMNGVLDAGEATSLASHGIVELSTSHADFKSSATLADGQTMLTEDLWFNTTAGTGTNSLRLALIGLAIAGLVGLVARRRRTDTVEEELAQMLRETSNV